MVEQAFETIFRARVTSAPTANDVQALAETLSDAKRKSTPSQRAEFAAMLAHAAFLAPGRVADVYDAATTGWERAPVRANAIPMDDTPSLPAPDGLWNAYFAVVRDAAAGKLDALSITERTAALGGMMGPEFSERLVTASHAYPGVSQAAQNALPNLVTLDQLAAEPHGSLARQFHDLIVDNTFDLEVLDRDELGLSALPKPLDYLNTRILQSHDLWHIVAGYETTALHEIAISAFQMAQFGHNYSAQFLAVTFGVAAVSPAYGLPVLADTVFSAWRHGRETPPMMLIDWENEWNRSTDDIRTAFQISPYESPHPANLIERTAPVAKLLRALSAPFRMIARPFRAAA